MAAAVLGAVAQQTDKMVFDLTVRANFDKCTQWSEQYDRSSYDAWSFITYSGYPQMYNYMITNGYYNDNLTTPDLDLEAGNMYVVKYKPTAYMSSDDGMSHFTVLLGQGDDITGYRKLQTIDKVPYENYSTTAPSHEVSFVVPESGKYRVSFNAGPRAIYLKEAAIVNRGQSATPEAPKDFTLTPDPEGELNVSISFTMPETTITGQPLTDLKYNLYRGVQKIKNGVAAAPGEKVSLTETRGESGKLVYSVEAVSGEETSEKLTAETYLGPETPEAPADVTLAGKDDVYTISWTAPATGIHGASLVADKLSYNVSRVLDGEASVIAEGLAECSLTDKVVADGLQTLCYTVEAVYGKHAMKSEAASSPVIKIGTVSLPFADSFANATLSPLWDNELVFCSAVNPASNHYWQAREKMDTRMITTEAYDGDNGLLLYNSYNIQKTSSCRLSTPPVAYNEGDKPVLTFAMYHISAGNDILKVQLSCDYGEWTDVPDATFTPKGEPAGAWSEHNVNLARYIPEGTKSYRVALTGETAYGQDIVVDAVRIFNLIDKDLEVASVNAPAEILAGNSVKISVKVVNNGVADVEPGDYSLAIESDFPDEIEIPALSTIPRIGNTIYEIEIPVSSLHLTDANTFTFTAHVDYAGDGNESNNTSEPVEVNVSYSAGTPATDLSAKLGEDGAVTLSWTAAKDLEYEEVAITESFEDESFADGSTGPFNGWTTIDLDGKAGDRWYTAGDSQFNVAVKAGTPSGKDGQNVLGVTVASNAQQDDWIISPKIKCRAGNVMNLKFMMGCKQISSWGNNYEVSLLYTTADEYDILNPQNDFTETVGSSIKSTSYSDRILPQDNKMYELEFNDIPAEATYVALHFTSKGSYSPAMWVDNIRLTEFDANPLLGYRVYSLNGEGLVNDELVDANATEYTLPAVPQVRTFANARNMFVTAVYADGEAEPSNTVNVDDATSGVEGVAADSDADAPIEYFNLQGVRVDNPGHGIYIRRQGNKVSKTSVR